jgi:hypothetical protein
VAEIKFPDLTFWLFLKRVVDSVFLSKISQQVCVGRDLALASPVSPYSWSPEMNELGNRRYSFSTVPFLEFLWDDRDRSRL